MIADCCMSRATYHFGPFSIDSEARVLFRDGERVPLPPKAADLLIALVEREGQIVTKDELLKQVWPDTFVEEGNLARHISLLRKILGETAGGASYVETAPKRGYRFLRPGVECGDATVLIAEEHTREHIVLDQMDTPRAPARRFGRRTAAMVLGVLAAAGLLGAFVWTRARTATPVRSVLVLPFANLSTDRDSEYYSDGLTEELIGAFSGVNGLRVVPRTTAFHFKGKSGDVRAIGRQLEVDAVLDGGLRREGDRLRIHISLTRVSDGHTIWSQTYDHRVQAVFETQEDIARSVLRTVFPGEQRAIDVPSPSGTRNLEAQNLFLRGKFIREKLGSSMEDALAFFRRAADLDPYYAQAWAGQAHCYAGLGLGYLRYPKDVFPLAVQAIGRALALNPRLPLAHAIQGSINLIYLRDLEAAKRELEAAIELDPNSGEGHHWMSHYWVSMGKFKEAIQESRRALEVDPLNFAIGAHQAWIELHNARYREAISAAEAMLRLDPQHGRTMWYLMRAYEESGQLREAIQVRQRMGWNGPLQRLQAALTASGPPGYWRIIVEQLEGERRQNPVQPVIISTAYAHLGDRQRALSWLERAVEERDPFVVHINVDPWFTALRGDARFQEIVRKAGIP